MSPSKSFLADAAIILALVLLGLVGYKLSPLLLPKSDVTVMPDAGCDLNLSPCSALLPDGARLRVSLEPRPIPLAEPFTARVEVDGSAVAGVAIDFAGVSMNMGLNRPQLAPSGDNRFAAPVTLPVCVTGRMEWQATVLVESARQRIAVPFRFVAGNS